MPQPRPQAQAALAVAVPVLLALLGAAVVPQAAAVKGLSSWNAGLITHYGGKQDGALGAQGSLDGSGAAAASPPAGKRWRDAARLPSP